MVSERKLIGIAYICLALVSLAAATRLSKQLSETVGSGFFQGQGKPLSRDASFIDLRSEPATQVIPADQAQVMTAKAYIVGNVTTGRVYIQHNSSVALPVASMSKLVTAMVALDTLPKDKKIVITPPEADVPPDGSGIAAGEAYTVSELMYPMLLDSSNVAAEALASSSNRAHFLELMSSYAWEIGMPTAFFADPSGVSLHNEASAKGLFALAQYLYKSRQDILAITRTAHLAVATTTDHGAHSFDSIHPFVKDPRFLGGKTGHTPEAMDTMMTIMQIDGQKVALIVLGSQDRAADTKLLIDKLESALAGI